MNEERQLLTGNQKDLLKAALEVTPGGVNSSLRNVDLPLVFVKAKGARCYDAEGKEYLDYHAGFGPSILGHCHPVVTKRIQETIGELDLVGVGTTPLEIGLAQKLVAHIPSVEKVLLCNSGSEATYHAIRLARAVTGRKSIIKFQGCYHGFHDSVAMNVITPANRMGQRDELSAGSLEDVMQHTLVCDFNDLNQVESLMKKNSRQVAAIILEPIPHNIGCVLPSTDFLEGLKALTRQQGIVLIFDEVVTGFRHHLGGYQKICGVTPDLTTLGKAMANGYPIAALGGRADLMDHFNTKEGGDVFFAGTYNGHPSTCAAALATIEVLENPGVYDHLFQLGDRMRKGLAEIMNRNKVRAVVTGFGSIFLTYFMDPPINSYTDLLRNDTEFFVQYRKRLVSKGIYKLPLNLKRNHLSLSHTAEDVDRTLEASEDTIKELML